MGLSQMQSQQETDLVLYMYFLWYFWKKSLHLHRQDEKFGETAGELSAQH